MPTYITTGYAGAGNPYVSSASANVTFDGNPNAGLFVSVSTHLQATGTTTITSVVLDPTGLNIPLTLDATFNSTSAAPGSWLGNGLSANNEQRFYKLVGQTIAAGTYPVVVTASDANGRLVIWASSFSDVSSATFYSEDNYPNTTGLTAATTISSATGRMVLAYAQATATPDAADWNPINGGTLRLRLKSTETGTVLKGAVWTYPGAASVSVSGTISGGVSNAQWVIGAWDIVGSALVDSTPPTMTGTVLITPSTTTATAICPTATDNVGVVAYDCSLDGGSTWPHTSGTPTINITGLTANTTYTGRFRARDAQGLTSSPVIVQAFTTNALPATASVTVTNIKNGAGTTLTTTIPNVVVLQRSNRALLVALTNQSVTAGTLTITNASLGSAGTGVMVAAFDDDGDPAGIWPATVA